VLKLQSEGERGPLRPRVQRENSSRVSNPDNIESRDDFGQHCPGAAELEDGIYSCR
jgi:hypothetical protein